MEKAKRGLDYTGVSIVFYCHDGEGNFVMNKRSQNCRDEQGCWDPGGGGLEFGESVLETLRREIQEEYCADALEQEFLGFRDVHREKDGVKTHWIALDFKVLVDRAKVKNGEPRKFDEIGWFTLDTLPSPIHSQLPTFIKNYEKKLRSSI